MCVKWFLKGLFILLSVVKHHFSCTLHFQLAQTVLYVINDGFDMNASGKILYFSRLVYYDWIIRAFSYFSSVFMPVYYI